MEDQPPILQTQPPPEPVTQPGKRFQTIGPKVGVFGFFIVLLAIIGVGAALGLKGTQKSDNNKSQEQASQAVRGIDNTVVYGFWSGNSSVIKAYDLSSGTDSELATLPLNIKHVKIISPTSITYIKNTDEYDHGDELVSYDLSTKKETSLLKTTSAEFGIDDYVISPDGTRIAVWEVSISPTTNSFTGGKSRVYSLKIGETQRLLYDETASLGTSVHYPLAVTNDGVVFVDRFLPNSGTGWAYGMEYVDSSGKKTPIDSMSNGTYSTQPILSGDGTKLVFAGYDGLAGDGKEDVGGIRRAIVNPNTVETFDLSTLKRTSLVSGDSESVYPAVFWDSISSNILYTQVSSDEEKNGTYSLNSITGSKRAVIENKELKNSEQTIISSLSGGKFLEGVVVTSKSGGGNLGSKYAPSVSALYVFDAAKGAREKVTLQGGYSQIVSINSGKYFGKLTAGAGTGGGDGKKDQQLQLNTFSLKPTLVEKREDQQSDPPEVPPGAPKPVITPFKCNEVASKICNELLGTNYPPEVYNGTPDASYNQCFNTQGKILTGGALSTCPDSPLYLYGTEGKKVKVSIGTSIYSPNVSFSPETGFTIVLGKDGRFIANGSDVESLAFDYRQALKKVEKPDSGYIVSSDELISKLREIAQEFRFNSKETYDVTDFAKQLDSPYIFVSFYDELTSRKILPILFDPQPDSYRNIVFYFEKLADRPNVSIKEPVILPVKRIGFTAIEISFIVN